MTKVRNMKLLNIVMPLIALGTFLIGPAAMAAKCPKNKASTTTYYTPDVRKLCNGSSKPCSRFRKEVKMQGSGTLPGNKILTYTGKIKHLGECDTTIGAAGTCMKPYITVAADPRYYNMGDIIYLNAFRGVKIKLDDGTYFTHHGYFIVEDTGGAIKGSNRFDVYTGSANLLQDGKNQHLVEMGLTDKKDCSDEYLFTVVRKNTTKHTKAMAIIEQEARGENAEEIGRMAEATSKGVE